METGESLNSAKTNGDLTDLRQRRIAQPCLMRTCDLGKLFKILFNLRFTITVMKPQDQKRLGKERICLFG